MSRRPSRSTHRPVMRRRDRRRLRARCRRASCSTPRSAAAATARRCSSPARPAVLGIDRDPDALAAATARLARFGDRFRAVARRFDDLDDAMPTTDSTTTASAARCSTSASRRRSSTAASAASPTATTVRSTCAWTRPSRGRRPTSSTATTSTSWRRVIRRYGDERFAARIARAIVAARPIETTAELAAVVTAAIPAAARRTGGHPAKRTFQAIRIEVNGELDALPVALDAAIEAHAPGGRIAVLSYHSGEDRIVKERFRVARPARATARPTCRACAAPCRPSASSAACQRPSAAEQAANRRAASARLRVAERSPTSDEWRRDADVRRVPVEARTPRRGTPAVAATPTPSTGVAAACARAAAAVAVNAALVLVGVVVVLMLAAVVLHTRLAERQLEIDRSSGSSPRRGSASTCCASSAPSCARRPAWRRGRRARHASGAGDRVPRRRPGDAGPRDRRRRHVDERRRRPTSDRDPLDQFRRVKAR